MLANYLEPYSLQNAYGMYMQYLMRDVGEHEMELFLEMNPPKAMNSSKAMNPLRGMKLPKGMNPTKGMNPPKSVTAPKLQVRLWSAS